MITTDVYADRLEMHVYGRLTLDECKDFEHLSDYRIHFGAPLDLLLDLRGLESCSLDAALEPLRYGKQHAHDFNRIAIVSDNGLVTWLALFALMMVDADVQVFSDDALAHEWLGMPTTTSDVPTQLNLH